MGHLFPELKRGGFAPARQLMMISPSVQDGTESLVNDLGLRQPKYGVDSLATYPIWAIDAPSELVYPIAFNPKTFTKVLVHKYLGTACTADGTTRLI